MDTFDQLTDDLRYQQAIASVKKLIASLDLSPREQAGLEAEIGHLHSVLQKLEDQVLHIAAFGMVGRGKSSLLNALVGQPVFQTGPLHGVTRQAEGITWQVEEDQQIYSATLSNTSSNQTGNQLASGKAAARVELIDTPGIDEVAGSERQVIAQKIARQADLILFVVASDLTQLEHDALIELYQAGKPVLLVFNKSDQYAQSDRVQILEKIQTIHVTDRLPAENIVIAAAAPLIKKALRQSDGQLITLTERGPADVSALKLRILEILQKEGKALVALNTLLYADDINQQVVEKKLALRDRAADDTIWKTVLTKSVAVALNPLTVVDLLSGAAIDIALIVGLAKLYGIEMTQKGAAQLLKKIALSLGGLTVSELAITFGLSGLKSVLAAAAIPTGGLTASPYVSVALAQATVSGVSTYAIAQVTKTYLANGATWGKGGPKAVVAQILSELDEDSIMQQIRQELATKLELQRWAKSNP
ncbi:GTPase, putative [Synechococcus sp. PCC 7335]|nr:GTPase, putative [Synechococcus sp. PCC 7335]